MREERGRKGGRDRIERRGGGRIGEKERKGGERERREREEGDQVGEGGRGRK